MDVMRLANTSEIYLDNNATTKVLPAVASAAVSAMCEYFGNPSSIHTAGDRSREIIRLARADVAELLGCDSSSLCFTGSGTESNNIILSSSVSWSDKPRVITSNVEHSSILSLCDHLEDHDYEVIRVPVGQSGLLDMRAFKAALNSATALVSIQWVNNETGVVQPVEEIGALCREAGVLFHTDAAQAVGKLPITLSKFPIDFVSLTGHKLHAPQGVGVIYARDFSKLRPIMFGGTQENGLRPGTENLAGIAGIGKAASIRRLSLAKIVSCLNEFRKLFEKRLLESIPDIVVNGVNAPRVCNTTNVLFEGVDGQALVARLDQAGIRCSQSSACTNQRPEPSYVLKAMGLSEDQAYASVRFSFSELNTHEEIEMTVKILATLCAQLRAFNS